ncbi:acyltransferase family protein [Pseudoxanthomonas sp. JBR18]|uniref:acyltransferase family protein n=1 Tax=Pseudoxanthomonas sp. JBR18 TaxID=2969308 RepID=UPI002305500F|nr:acyltransferase family protein [Pseudoxanthomonas sp. JBR18]WCE05934.1 acyltransferase family protein [Pseudoxanthomonas sp. JBR18]
MGDTRERAVWIDVLRGICGLLVIVAHAEYFARAEAGADWASAMDTLWMPGVDALNLIVSPLRMELLFLLSGMFLARSLAKGRSHYFRGKLDNVVYPFLVWLLLNFALREGGSVVMLGESVNWWNLAELLVGHAPPTWFLFDLALFFLVAPWLRRFPIWILVPALVALSILVGRMATPHDGEFFYHLAFFLCGDAIVRARLDLTRPPLWWLGVSTLCLVATSILALHSGLAKTWPGYLPLVLGSVPLLAWLAARLAQTPLAPALAYVGRNAIVFYVVHFTLFIALIVVLRKVTHDGVWLFVGLLTAGVGTPLALCLLRVRRGWRWLDLLFSPALLRARHRVSEATRTDPA